MYSYIVYLWLGRRIECPLLMQAYTAHFELLEKSYDTKEETGRYGKERCFNPPTSDFELLKLQI